MTKSRDLRPAIERLAKEKKKASEIARLLNVPRRTVYDFLKRLEETRSIDDRRRSGRPKQQLRKNRQKNPREDLVQPKTINETNGQE